LGRVALVGRQLENPLDVLPFKPADGLSQVIDCKRVIF
jgi:hypothetical protein